MLNIGHRGAMGHAPENTLAAIQKALELGVDWIEVDVYAVEDELIVIHDDTLERTTNGSGSVMAHSLTYLRGLDAGDGEKIPLLSEVFELVDRQVGINVELKGPNTAVPTTNFLQHQLNSGWTPEQLLLSSFDHRQLLIAKSQNPLFPRAALYYSQTINFEFVTKEVEAVSINPWLGHVSPQMIRKAHSLGLKVFVYTVNKLEDIQRMAKWGVDAVFTNYPDRVNQVNETFN